MAKIHARDAKSHDLDIVINLDDDKDSRAIDSIGGLSCVRVVVWKGGKRAVGWFSVGLHGGKVVMRVTVNNGGKEVKKDIKVRPWLDQDKTRGDSPEGV
jgi:hypothetical protein